MHKYLILHTDGIIPSTKRGTPKIGSVRGIIYEVYTRSFSPAGNFTGVEKRLPELKKLGITILWMMPIRPVGVLHRKGTIGSRSPCKITTPSIPNSERSMISNA